VKKFLFFVALIAGGIWYYGSTLPREHTIKSTIVITTAQVDTVYLVMRRMGNYAQWWSDVRSVRPLTGRRKESWEQNTVAAGLITQEVTSATPPNRMTTTIIPNEEALEGEMKWGGTWKYYVFQGASGTQVEITETGWVESPFYRVFMKLRGEYRTVDSYLTSLAAHFGEMSTPRHRD